MGKKSGRNQKKNAAGKEASTTKGSYPGSKTKNNKGQNKGHHKGHPRSHGVFFEISGGPEFHGIGYPVEQQPASRGWDYPDQVAVPWSDYVGYYTNNQFIAPEYFQTYPVWDSGNGASITAMGYGLGNEQPSWCMSTFTEQMQTVDEMISGITTGATQATEFRLRADAPEFVPHQKLATQASKG